MNDLDIIIPVLNEAKNIPALLERVVNSFNYKKVAYSIIFVVDKSTDGTSEVIKSSLRKYVAADGSTFPFDRHRAKTNLLSGIYAYAKKGAKGKAFSIIEGIGYSKAAHVAMIDGDLQYPPEALPDMYALAVTNGIAVAERVKNETSMLRKYSSKIGRTIFGKVLHDIGCDIQSGLKVFKREIFDRLDTSHVTEWTLDLSLLKCAKDLGYEPTSFPITFDKRIKGYSKVNFLKTSFEIAINSLKLWFTDTAYEVPGSRGNLNKGLIYNGRKFTTHSNLSYKESALITFSAKQRKILLGFLAVSALLFVLSPVNYLKFIVIVLTLFYFADMLFSYFLLSKGLEKSCEITFTKKELGALVDKYLPLYTILCPLYKEAGVLEAFVKAIEKIDWPKNKLEVFLLLEEDDKDTQEKARNLALPSYFKTLIVPNSQPKTKPKACNYGLHFAKGEYVVIYDAEDRPDPLQLKKAYRAFSKVSSDVVCLQSKLNYYNKGTNLLTQLFTAEYSLWFDVILPGLQSIKTIIPLGGTSNHFKTQVLKYIEGWDPFNVTEDCDLGVRLYKKGFKTAIIDSTTYEEANSKVRSWIKQRSRWIKGYLQTYLVHSRNYIEFVKKQGIHALLFNLVIGLRMIFMVVNPILWIVTVIYFVFNSFTGSFIESLYDGPVFYVAALSMVFGNFLYMYQYMIGLAKRGVWDTILYVFFMPLYWLLGSYAACIALYQLFKKPYYWEKTEHGLHLEPKVAPIKKPAFFKLPELRLPKVSFALPTFTLSFNKELSFGKKITSVNTVLTSDNTKRFAALFLVIFSLLPIGGLLAVSEVKKYLHLTDPSIVVVFAPFILMSLSAAINYAVLTKYSRFIILGVSLALFEIAVVTQVTGLSLSYISRVFGIFTAMYAVLFTFLHMIYLKFSKAEEIVVSIDKPLLKKDKRDKPAILIINWRDSKHIWGGGAEIYLHEITRRWVKKGYAVTFFCGNDRKNKEYEIIDGVEVIRKGGFYTVYIWAFFYYIFRLRGKYDLIVDSENGLPFFTPLYSRVPKVLLIHHIHQDVFLNHLRFPLGHLAKFLEQKVMPLVYRNVKKVTVSNSSRVDMMQFGLGTSKDIDIVNPGIEPKDFTISKKTSYPSILYLGRLKHYKSVDLLIKVLPDLLKLFPTLKLKIAGYGESKSKLTKLAKSLHVEKRVQLLGRVSDRRKVSLMGSSWVFAYPSTMEGWGIAAIEASAAGTAVVATNTKGLRDSVLNNRTGLLFKKGDTRDLTKKLTKVLSDKAYRKVMQQNGRQWSKNFTWNKSAEAFLKIVEDEIEKRSFVESISFAEN